MSASPSSKALNSNICLTASQFINILCILSRPFRICFCWACVYHISCFMNNLTIQVYFSSHFPGYFNNINCSPCIDQNRLKANSFESFLLRMRVSVKYQGQLLKYHNIASGFKGFHESDRFDKIDTKSYLTGRLAWSRRNTVGVGPTPYKWFLPELDLHLSRERATLAPSPRNSGVGHSGLWPPLHCGDSKHLHSQARSVLQDLGLNILLYEKQTRLINSNNHVGPS